MEIWLCDDGQYKSKFEKDKYWPTPVYNKGNCIDAGDLRQMVDDHMTQHENAPICESGEDKDFKTTKVLLPTEESKANVVARADCSLGLWHDRYVLPGVPTVNYVSRLKPKDHKSKAGNINNVLYNCGADGTYAVIFDNDMEPHPKFLIATLPCFFEEIQGATDDESPYTDDVKRNSVAFVQTPQYFKKTYLTVDRGDPLSHENTAFFDSGLPGMDGYGSAMFVGTNCVWRRAALDDVGGINYGTISEDFWTGHQAHWKGWTSAYMRKDTQGDVDSRFRLAEGTVPPNVAAALAQRKRWHKGGVELFLGVKNVFDENWERPVVERPEGFVTARITRFRKWHWFFARLAFINAYPPVFYTILVLNGLIVNKMWIYLNPYPTYAIMIPRLFLASFVPSLGDSTVDPKKLAAGVHEFFCYAPIRFLGNFEVFYSRMTGKPAKWGNTGGIGSGSIEEIPVVLFCVLIYALFIYSVMTFMFVSTQQDFYQVIPVWCFAYVILTMYLPFARVSIQEYFGYSYKSFDGAMTCQYLVPALVVFVTTVLSTRD